jgi:AcrR family transcriptional regulator
MSHEDLPAGSTPAQKTELQRGDRPAREASAAVRERFLDAAESCYTRFGLAKTTVEDVARAAGVSRATVYRHFRNRDELLLGVLAREASRLAADSEIYLQRFDDVGSWIVEGMLYCLAEIPNRPLMAMFFAPEDVGVASRAMLTSERLLEIGADILRPLFEPARRQGLLRESVELEALMEWVLRILTSYLTVPSHLATSEAELRRLLRVMIVPAVLKHPDSGRFPGATPIKKESRDG